MKYFYGITICLVFMACNKNVLDRPPLTNYMDDKYWRNEDDVRMYVNTYYPNYFNGYNSSFTVDYAPVRGYTFNDDLTKKNVQTNFESTIPNSRGSYSESAEWLQNYGGPTWDFAWVRKSNVLLDRLENVLKAKIPDEAYKHWAAVGRFFRGFEYSRLVSVFGNIPYYDRVIEQSDLNALYKDRENRGLVMDKVYDDFKYALANMRENDGAQLVNKYIAAAFISRLMLFEGTFEHYHGIDEARAKKYLEFAAEAADIVMTSNKYQFGSDFKALFSSDNLSGNPEVILYRSYDAGQSITHAIGSYQNGTEVVGVDANLVLMKSFILNDGRVWQDSASSSLPHTGSFAIADLIKTRDPRFEASFFDKPLGSSATLLYGFKFASREALTYIGKPYPPAWGSNTNTSDAPVIRLAEVVLNWIEAKAELAEHFGGSAVTQNDIDKSINAIRDRPLDGAAIAKGIKKTAHLSLASLPNDPARDGDVSPLLWEIRRERRMEFVFEFSRLMDLKRWKKIQYMNFTNPDYFLGPWVNVPVEIPSALSTTTIGKARVKKADGTVITYDGTNAANMVGYWMVENASNRNAFTDRVYTSPVGTSQIQEYESRGYKLTQTNGW
ncbi:RagB/SusD family nutrient uptake outer membrane protein [Niabella beijingensis]|uniref:RagB/SusD family nutrient uptake outer membrane protein n=1 Tax=Niabella beijingensis TaxID=2872700 RepID=UPI001CBE2045|nr:RagB/SusD family nutrient uptake outer membrane protein [Niabella beijingensis]MBZ4188182.1 RagB/SusD family nutrient uptake outer membrane protein [Niabella beijingensis]